MKAYIVSDRNGACDYSCVVFAETRAKAIKHALDYSGGAFDWCTWTDMRAIRSQKLDEYYRGNAEMDWCNERDRVAMVKHAGFRCTYEMDVTTEECRRCAAHEWCDRYESMTR